MGRWIADGGAPVSLAVLPLPHRPGELRAAVARLRRALRDVRDRAAQRLACWRGVAIAGMATGDGTAFVRFSHTGATRSEVASVLRKRWPAAVVGGVDSAEPTWDMPTADAAELARIRRGVEPLRIVVLAQRSANPAERGSTLLARAPTWLEPMPVVF